ncbi:MAG: glycosyltransferase family 2 protein, partial [Alphaproteobacteria bacterium]
MKIVQEMNEVLQTNAPTQSKTEFGWPIISQPKVGVIITHHNYSEFIEKAINSVLNQTYSNFECVVVDDCSNKQHQEKLRELMLRYSERIKFVFLEENVGQIPAFYAGVDRIKADFYCLLDPDDRYFEAFIEDMVAVHLNPYMHVSMVCCDQVYVNAG